MRKNSKRQLHVYVVHHFKSACGMYGPHGYAPETVVYLSRDALIGWSNVLEVKTNDWNLYAASRA